MYFDYKNARLALWVRLTPDTIWYYMHSARLYTTPISSCLQPTRNMTSRP